MAAKSSTKRKRTRSKKKSSSPAVEIKGTGMKLGLGLAALLVTGICLFVVLILPPQGSRTQTQKHTARLEKAQPADKQPQASSSGVESRQPGQPEAQARGSNAQDQQVMASQASTDRAYEEAVREDLEQGIREVDLALVQCLILQDIDPDRLEHDDVKARRRGKQTYYHQTISLRLSPSEQKDFLFELRHYLADWVDGARLKDDPGNDSSFHVTVYGRPTHQVRFRPGDRPRDQRLGEAGNPQLAIVIDDLGESLAKAKALASILGREGTWAVLPNCTYTDQIVDLASHKGIDVLLHLPMEPMSYPEVDPGAGSLFVDMDKETIRRTLTQDLEQISGAVGVNNHMGSRFTKHEQGMRTVLKLLKQRQLFFMDSLTNPDSQARSLAGEIGIPHVSRDIFIDNEQRVEAIVYQLQKAERLARRSGQVVAIGHPYPETIQALRQWSAGRKTDVELCSVRDIIEAESGQETRTASRQSSRKENTVW
jgi:hypothetical protein